MLGSEIIERQTVALAVIFDEQTQFITEIILQAAPVYIEHLIESSPYMKPGGIAVREILAAAQLIKCEPLFIGKRIFHLIAVFPYIFRSENRQYFRQFHFGYTLKGIGNLLLLALEL